MSDRLTLKGEIKAVKYSPLTPTARARLILAQAYALSVGKPANDDRPEPKEWR